MFKTIPTWVKTTVVILLVVGFFGHPLVHFAQEILSKLDTLIPGGK